MIGLVDCVPIDFSRSAEGSRSVGGEGGGDGSEPS
jgi:hypothetical protein